MLNPLIIFTIATCFIPLLHWTSWFYVDIFYFSLIPFVSFVLIPFIDLFLPRVTKKTIQKENYSSSPLYIYATIQTLTLIYSLYRSDELINQGRYLTYVMQILSMAIVTTAPSAAVAHELIHKLNRTDRLLGTFLFAQCMYSHFPIEHVYGHHKNVATDVDPASARKGETIYAFIPRSVYGTLKHVWKIENERLRCKYSELSNSIILFENRLIKLIVFGDILLPIIIYLLMGSIACWTFIQQAIWSILLIESTNYLEHYGLRRMILESGETEPVTELHSWDAPYTISNYIYVNLMLHADHHMHPLKSYYQLQPMNAPQLPYGYATLFIISLIPSLYFRVMHSLPALRDK